MEVQIHDYSEYQSGKSSNGGAYGFWSIYKEVWPGWFEVSHHTTADFDYCDRCGRFDSNCHCDGIRETISRQRLDELVKEAENNPSEEIGWKIVDGNPLADPAKVRRRIEDRLRKEADEKTLYKVAIMLGVKTT